MEINFSSNHALDLNFKRKGIIIEIEKIQTGWGDKKIISQNETKYTFFNYRFA